MRLKVDFPSTARHMKQIKLCSFHCHYFICNRFRGFLSQKWWKWNHLNELWCKHVGQSCLYCQMCFCPMIFSLYKMNSLLSGYGLYHVFCCFRDCSMLIMNSKLILLLWLVSDLILLIFFLFSCASFLATHGFWLLSHTFVPTIINS